MLAIITKGGIFMWPLLVIYFIAFAIIVERAIFFYLSRYNLGEIKNKFLISKDPKIIKQNIEHLTNNVICRVLETYLSYFNTKSNKREELITIAGEKEIARMEQYLWGLSLAGHIAPLIGLLGTITGMMATFRAIELAGGQVDISVLAGGIWEAMITTAAGLIIAIPALIAFHYFQNIINQRVKDMQEILAYIDFYVSENNISIDFSKRDSSHKEVESEYD